jgi:6-phosphogluconolactonase (cycloisomerase 2 family)
VKALTRFIPAAAAAIAVTAFAAPAAFAASPGGARGSSQGAANAVFALTDNTAANAVVAYDRAANGTLTPAGTYSTNGLGGVLAGSVVDHTASQGSLTYDQAHGLLFAVNPGSDTVAVFSVNGDQLTLNQVIASGGDFPVSVTVHGNVAYVLNALGGGELAGFTISNGQLAPIAGSGRPLGLGTTDTTPFTNTPSEVAFTPDGTKVLVSTKANGNDVDVFAVQADGSLATSPTVNPLPGDVPFAFTFNGAGDVVVAETGINSVATFSLSAKGTLTQLAVAATGQKATCWVVKAGQNIYASNAGSGSVSGYQAGQGGSLTALGNTSTDTGTVDAASAGSGRFLYVQAGKAGIVDEFAIGSSGALTPLGSVTVPGAAGGEGIAAV